MGRVSIGEGRGSQILMMDIERLTDKLTDSLGPPALIKNPFFGPLGASVRVLGKARTDIGVHKSTQKKSIETHWEPR